ncbi:MAG TPA: SRPBCC family protein [Chloroflexota bacterium]|nr:SRPBCC family protein [Chloroflexota bacterium]
MSVNGEMDGGRAAQEAEGRRRFGLNHHAEASIHIDALPQAVWAVVADVTRNGEWSGETLGCEWVGDARAAEPGARFRGRNLRRGWRWTRTSEILRSDTERELVWRTVSTPVYPDSTEWRITLAPEDGGTRVTEGFRIVRMSRLMDFFLYWFMPVHRDRTPDLQEDLQRLKRVVEAARSRPGSA